MSLLDFRLPDVGEGLSEAEIVKWHVAPGDRVERDQVIVEVQTDKSIVELPAPADGVVDRLGGDAGDVLAVGAIVAVFRLDGPTPARPSEDTAPAEPAQGAAAEPASSATGNGAPGGRRPLAAPATRKLAVELGVDLAAVEGSGPGGRITKDDVRQAADAVTAGPVAAAAQSAEPREAATPAAAPAQRGEDEVVPLRGLRRRIAQTMTEAWERVPHITDMREIDATGLVSARARLRGHLRPDVRLTYLPLLVKAVVVALRRYRKFNASLDWDAQTVTYHAACNIGIATATDEGLIVPVVHDADRLGLVALARETERLAEAARTRRIAVEDTSGGTCTITNTGTYGGWLGTPIIRPPEAAIVGVGRIADTVVAQDGQPVVRPTLPLSVAADHRLIDGHELGAFVATLEAVLADPILLLVEDR